MDGIPHNQKVEPNRDAIYQHLEMLFHPRYNLPVDTWFEIVWGEPVDDGALTNSMHFSPTELEKAADFAFDKSWGSFNVYVSPGLRKGVAAGKSNRANTTNFACSNWAWAEFDGEGDEQRVKGILEQNNLKPDTLVLTGAVPWQRIHLYFRLDQSVTRSDELKAANVGLQKLLGTDPAVTDPIRIMRLGGTVNRPPPKKAARGYVSELVRLHRPPAPEYTAAHLTALGSGGRADEKNESDRKPGRTPDEIIALLERTKIDGHWHNNMLKAIASMIGKGWTDEAIRVACHPYCEDGAADRELAPMIKGARRKGWGEGKKGDESGVDENALPDFAPASPELIAKLNARFFLIVEGAGTVVEIIRQEQGVLEFNDYSPEGFRLKYCNKFVKIERDDQKEDKDKWIALANYFLSHPDRRDYNKRIFAPGRTLKHGEFNTFPGFPIAPTETGDCSLFWQHLEQNVCGGEKVVYTYVRKWIAHIFQNPGEKSGVAVVVVGKERGAGKTIIADILNVLLGDSLFVRIENQEFLTGSFTKHRDNKLLINFEESINPNDPRAVNVLKSLITTGKRLSHPKYIDAKLIDTFERILMTSNEEEEAVHVEQGDRRVLVIKARPGWSTPHPTSANEWVPKLIERNGRPISIFKAMLEDLAAGGYGSLMYDLMAEDLSDFNAWDFPRTEARTRQSLGSLSIELKFYYDVLAERADEFFIGEYLLKSRLYEEFVKFARSAGRAYGISNVKFGKELKGVWPAKLKESIPKKPGKTRFKIHQVSAGGPWRYVLGTIEEHRKAFTAETNIPFDDEDHE